MKNGIELLSYPIWGIGARAEKHYLRESFVVHQSSFAVVVNCRVLKLMVTYQTAERATSGKVVFSHYINGLKLCLISAKTKTTIYAIVEGKSINTSCN